MDSRLIKDAMLSLSRAIEHDCVELCKRNGLTEQETRMAIHVADDLGCRASLSSIEVMQTDEFWKYIGIARKTLVNPSHILQRKVLSAIEERTNKSLSRKMDRWDNYFMGIAEQVAKNSKCLSRQIGAVLVKDKSIISTGYNGASRGIPHCENRNPNKEMVCPRRLAGYESGEGLHICIAGHAEVNAIINAARMGIETKGATLYCTCGVPCKDCLIALINAGIEEVVCRSGRGGVLLYYDEMSEYLVAKSDIVLRTVEQKEE